MPDLEDSIIGTGWAFPPRFDPSNASAVLATGEEDIVQSLAILFGTQRGERILEREYGCDLLAHVFQPISPTDVGTLEDKIRRAIMHFESRINLEDVTLDVSESLEGKLYINLSFTIETTNNRRNIVFPFFAAEGTLIPDS